ncbi:MAG: hypothetical protein ACTSUJ_09220 [Candidatus Njordarchaeales archaeon]
MTLIQLIKNKYDHAVIYYCKERGCELKLTGLNEYIILKGEKLCQSEKVCDCIIFAQKLLEDVTIGLIELKSRTAHFQEIEEKLAGGARLALRILDEISIRRLNVGLYPIVLAKSWRIHEYQILINRRIKVGGKQYRIIPKKCGSSLLKILQMFFF